MGFLSFKFILFIALTFFMFFVVPKKFQWLVLLLFSFLYYYLNSHLLIAVIIYVSLYTFVFGLLIDKLNQKIKECSDKQEKERLTRQKTLAQNIGIFGVLANLIVIKYGDFIIENINSLINGHISFFDFVLPLGISFYTLQAISYLLDVSKKKCEADRNIFHFMLYMSYFPQIIQGPIPRYSKLAHQLYEEHDYDYIRVCHGLQLMFYGIAKKVIIADALAKPVGYIFDNSAELKGLSLLFGALLYSIQIYADFSGGVDAIKGISEVFGIYLDDNFRGPYFSRSIEEFWRRWHISLGSFMKDYVFYPLSLNKKLNNTGKKLRKIFGNYFGKRFAPCVAMFVVYLLVGIWHGASWKYMAYGIWNGVFIMSGILLEKYYEQLHAKLHIAKESKSWIIFSIIRTFFICSIGRIFSRSSDLPSAFTMLGNLFGHPIYLSDFSSAFFSDLGLNGRIWLMLGIMMFIVFMIDYFKEKGIDIRMWIDSKNTAVRWMIYYILIMSILVFGLYGGAYDGSSFIYGRF